MSKVILTLTFLIISNTFMTLAWYGNLKLQEMKLISSSTPLYLIVLLSWGIALLEYSFLIPANRIGSDINGGPFSLVQLKVIQEVVSCIIRNNSISALQRRESAVEPHSSLSAFGTCSLFRIHEMMPPATPAQQRKK